MRRLHNFRRQHVGIGFKCKMNKTLFFSSRLFLLVDPGSIKLPVG